MQVMKESHLRLGLTVVYFEDGESEVAKITLEGAATATPNLATHFILLRPQQFSRSLALKEGVEQSSVTAPIVFLCDVDVLFTSKFLHRCLATPVRGKQVCLWTLNVYIHGSQIYLGSLTVGVALVEFVTREW